MFFVVIHFITNTVLDGFTQFTVTVVSREMLAVAANSIKFGLALI